MKSHFEGITNGVTSLFRGGILNFNNDNKKSSLNQCTSGFKLAEKLNFSNFHPM